MTTVVIYFLFCASFDLKTVFLVTPLHQTRMFCDTSSYYLVVNINRMHKHEGNFKRLLLHDIKIVFYVLVCGYETQDIQLSWTFKLRMQRKLLVTHVMAAETRSNGSLSKDYMPKLVWTYCLIAISLGEMTSGLKTLTWSTNKHPAMHINLQMAWQNDGEG